MIGLLNCRNDIKEYLLSKSYDIIDLNNSDNPDFKNIHFLYINWISSSYNGNDQNIISALIKQAFILDNYKKLNCKILIFDGDISINEKEYNWFINQSNIFLYEPQLINRRHFSFLPFTIIPNKSINSNKISDFCIIGSKKDYDYPVVNNDFRDFKFSLIQDERHYRTGYMINLSDILSSGCTPLITSEHRFYHALFDELVVKRGEDDLKYLLYLYNICEDLLIQDFYKRVDKFMPEMSIEYFCNIIEVIYG